MFLKNFRMSIRFNLFWQQQDQSSIMLNFKALAYSLAIVWISSFCVTWKKFSVFKSVLNCCGFCKIIMIFSNSFVYPTFSSERLFFTCDFQKTTIIFGFYNKFQRFKWEDVEVFVVQWYKYYYCHRYYYWNY